MGAGVYPNALHCSNRTWICDTVLPFILGSGGVKSPVKSSFSSFESALPWWGIADMPCTTAAKSAKIVAACWKIWGLIAEWFVFSAGGKVGSLITLKKVWWI